MGQMTVNRLQFNLGPLHYERLQKLKNKRGKPQTMSVDLFVKEILISILDKEVPVEQIKEKKKP